jgi:hypothetical protein
MRQNFNELADKLDKFFISDEYIATDLMNALPGNSSVNTVQQATIEEDVFFVSAVTS